MTHSQTVLTMQDTLLWAFVVALSLLSYPKDEAGVEEWSDITTVDMQKHEEKLQRGGGTLEHKMVSVGEEMTHIDDKEPQEDVKNIPKEQNQSNQQATEKDQLSILDDMTVTKQDAENADQKSPEEGLFVMNLDPNRQQNSKSEPEPALKTSQIVHEQKRGDNQTSGSFRDSGRLQEQQDNPEENEMFNSKKQESPPSHLHTKTSEIESTEKTVTNWEEDYLWYIWNTFSIISMIRLLRKYIGRASEIKQEESRPSAVTCTAAEVLLPDNDTLQQFHSKCVQVSSDRKWREDFLEGFVKELLDAMRTVCVRNDGLVIEDFQMVDVCDIIVPFRPADPCSFQCLLWNNQASDLRADMQVCGQIKLVENKKVQNGCPCQDADTDDMVCLLHCETEKVKTEIIDVCDGLLCMKKSPFLSKSQVTRWFQSTIKQAWALISHKYEFELNIRYIDAPGALVVQFRSGKKISFRMNPVVKFNTDAYFFIAPCSPNNLDAFWSLSLTKYEKLFLERLSKQLPANSCHNQTFEIALFLHNRQTLLSGSTALRGFHFKNALMHLLLTKDHSQWKPNCVAWRLRDLLDFMEKSLEKKLLHHVLIGNPLPQKVIELPAEFTQASTVNLFHPLVVHKCIYTNAMMHFQEMLRNAHMLIQDYVDHCISGD